jgi:hypothetical protein
LTPGAYDNVPERLRPLSVVRALVFTFARLVFEVDNWILRDPKFTAAVTVAAVA